MSSISPLLFEAENALVQLELERAAVIYARAQALDPDSPLPRIGIARIALAAGRFADGAALLDVLLSRTPASVEALTIRGLVAEKMGDAMLATTCFERALQHLPDCGPALFSLGRVLSQQQRWSEAARHLRRATELMPGVPEVSVAYATAAFKLGTLSEAVAVLRCCIKNSPYFVGGYTTLADVLVESGKLELADTLLASAEARFSRQAIFPAKRALIAMRRGDVADALVHARRQAVLTPADDEGWLLIAVLELSTLNVGGAEAAVHEVLRRNPKSWRAHYQLGRLYETLRLIDLAQHAYRNATLLAPAEWQPKNTLATLLLETETVAATNEARALLEQAVACAPHDERFMAQLNLAIACYKLGERAASERHAHEAMKTAPPSHPVGETARRFLNNFASKEQAQR